jgi:hypothetical protein
MPLPSSFTYTWNSFILHDKYMHVSLPHPTTLHSILFSLLLVLFKIEEYNVTEELYIWPYV